MGTKKIQARFKYLFVSSPDEGLVESPAVVPGNLEVSLELGLLGWNLGLGEVRLLDTHNLVPVGLDNIRSFLHMQNSSF